MKLLFFLLLLWVASPVMAGSSTDTPQDGTTTCGKLFWGLLTHEKSTCTPPTPRFSDNRDGTITDHLTQLIWMKNANCWETLTWDEAFAKVHGLNTKSAKCKGYFTGTHLDWRMPNKLELLSLIDYKRFNPVLPLEHPFIGVQSVSIYWSSTTDAGNPANAWFMFLNFGHFYTNAKTSRYFVWPVRGGTFQAEKTS